MKLRLKKILLVAAIGVDFGSAANAQVPCDHLNILCLQYGLQPAWTDYENYC